MTKYANYASCHLNIFPYNRCKHTEWPQFMPEMVKKKKYAECQHASIKRSQAALKFTCLR